MSDKANYASHGTFITKINESFLGKWDKPKNAVINPLPSTKPRQKPTQQEQNKMNLKSRTFNAKFKFQQPLNQKPVSQDLIQPFLYIEKVFRKRRVDEIHQNNKNNKDKTKMVPFVTSANQSKNKIFAAASNIQRKKTAPPIGYASVYDYQNDKKFTANLIFQKMLQSDIDNVKDLFHLWDKNPKRNLTQDINIKQEEFIDFVNELIPKKVTNATIKHFFSLYRNNATNKRAQLLKKGDEPVNLQKQRQKGGEISIRAFAFNYSKYRKAETQIINIMSQKAAKDRYTFLKKYISDFLSYYPQLKMGMKGMKQYQETLRKHFRRLYQSYKNPFEDEINKLNLQLQKPMIKYDKQKRQKTQKKIEEYELQNSKIYSKLTQDYHRFIQQYQEAIVKNHDLVFTKRTVAHLLWPIIERQPLLTRDLIQQQVGIRQQQKQRYLECLSDIVVQVQNDKKHIMEDCFTLGQIVQLVNMRFRNKKTQADQQLEQFTIESLKKLIKQIKRQFLVKFNLTSDDYDNFPADQQIPIDILRTCFEMQCTKVLFKNKIWSQLLQMLPMRTIESKLHQKSIDANTCMQYLNKYFKKLDQRMNIQRNKSKQISLLVQDAYNQNFGKYADIMHKIMNNLDQYIDGIQEQQDPKQKQKQNKKKKVGFADVVDSKLAVQRGEKSMIQPQPDLTLIKDIIKIIHKGAQGVQVQNLDIRQYNNKIPVQQRQNENQSPYKNLHLLKSMARSYFEPQAMNTNAFDIRYYQKMNEQQRRRLPEQQLIQLGSSMILSGAPPPQQIQGSQSDPLRISRFLLKTIDKQVKQQQKQVHNKEYDRDIYDGVSHNYYQQKIKLEKKPTRYDSEGKSKYSVLLPVGYYQSYIVGQNVPDGQKWYLRPHHVQTLTQNPLSKKDNVINTEYQSKLEKLGLKKRPDQFVIQQNVKRKQGLISELQQRILALKSQLNDAKRSKDIEGFKVNPSVVNDYYNKITQGKQDKQLQMAAYQGVLYDLRRKQRSLLNKHRSNETKQYGQPNKKWWQRKDKDFNRQLRKDRTLVSDSSGLHRQYVEKLKNSQIY